MHFKANILKHRLLFISLDAFGPIDDSLFKTGRLFCRQLEAFGDMRC